MALLSEIRKRVGMINGEGSITDTTRLSTVDELTRSVIEDIRSRQEWSFDRTTLNVTFDASGVSTTTLTNFSVGCILDARKINTDRSDNVYQYIDPWQSNDYLATDYPMWITGNDIDGWKLNIKDTDLRTLQVSYVREEAPLVNPTDATRIPLNVIVKGVYALLLKSDDNEVNNDREMSDYEKQINILRIKDDRYPKRAVSVSERQGYSLGDI